jgi:LysM repeat protein
LVAGSAAAGAGASAATGAGLLDGATFAGQGLKVPAINSSQVALIPEGTALAGQGLQVPTLPGLSAMGGGTGLAVGVPGGTVTQLGFVPTGATPVLGDPASFINNPDVLGNTVFSTDYLAAPGAAAGMSVTDALRLANQARNLLAGGQNPLVPQQQGLPQDGGAAGRGVDYSGLLSLLQLQARTPGVSSLTAPAQLRQIYQPTLLPNVLSLLG